MITADAARRGQHSRRAYSFEQHGALWMPCSKRNDTMLAWGAGWAGAFATRSALSPKDTPLNLPGNANLESWHVAERGLTLGSTLLAIGAAAPGPCTISADTGGSLTTSIGLYISFATSGTRGTATFNYSIDGGSSNYNVAPLTTGTDVAMPGTGLKVQFSAGTYTSGTHFYQATIAQWDNQTPLTRSLVAPTSASSRPVVSWRARNGRPTINSDATNGKNFKDITSNWASNLGAGSRTVYMMAKSTTATPSSTNAFFALNNQTDPDPFWKICVKNGTNDYAVVSTNDSGTGSTRTGGALDTNYHLLSCVFDSSGGTAITLYDNGSQVFTNTQSVSPQTFDEVFVLGDGGGHNLIGEIGELITYSAAHDTTTRQEIEAYLRSGWAF